MTLEEVLKENTALCYARDAIEHAFTMPTAGSAEDVPAGFVPWSMEDLEKEAIAFLTEDSALLQEAEDQGITIAPKLIEEAVTIIKDYFARCK